MLATIIRLSVSRHSIVDHLPSPLSPVHRVQGYGITLATINGLSVLCSVLEAIPSLPLQVRFRMAHPFAL